MDYNQPTNLILTAIVLGVGVSGAGVTVAGVALRGMALATVLAILLNLTFRLIARVHGDEEKTE